MVMAIETKDLVVKKMVYLYLCNYAASNSELAIMCINTLQRDCSNEDPMVRGLALRSICGLRIASAVEYMVSRGRILHETRLMCPNYHFQIGPLHSGLEDSNSYVRKTAVMGMMSTPLDYYYCYATTTLHSSSLCWSVVHLFPLNNLLIFFGDAFFRGAKTL